MPTPLSFLDIPATGTDQFIFRLSAAGISPDLITTFKREQFVDRLQQTPLSSVGFYVCHPARRLARAYLGLYEKGVYGDSFCAFYSHPQRRNIYSQSLGERPLEAFGFVGVDEYAYRSQLLASWQLGHQETAMTYRMRNDESEVEALLTEEHLDAIDVLHQQDVTLFKHAKSLVKARFDALFGKPDLYLKLGKSIVIHVGPPKTGTSTIQAWLKQQRATLMRQGIDYPDHEQDNNSVSSGNFLSVMQPRADRQGYQLSLDKLNAVLAQFAESNSHTLLLSSEHFYYHLPVLMHWLPEARFVFYIRHPLQSLESGYRQEVKRHQRTDALVLPPVVKFQSLSVMAEVVKEFETRLELGYFEKTLFRGGHLLADFATLISPTLQTDTMPRYINPSYNFAQLELMRLCNRFCDQDTLKQLDLWLQRQSQQQVPYTLLAASDIARAQQQLRTQVDALCLSLPSVDKNKLLCLLDSLPAAQHAKQTEAAAAIQTAWLVLKQQNPQLAYLIYKQQVASASQCGIEKEAGLTWHAVDRYRRYWSSLFGRKLPVLRLKKAGKRHADQRQ